MTFSIQNGVWPTMITPFTEEGTPDFKAIAALCDWYVRKGCAGAFAVCQSSEMAYLTKSEKLDIAKAVVDAIGGRIQVVASGHTADDKATQYEEIENMMKTGVDAYVLVSNRLDPEQTGEETFLKDALEVFERFPEVTFGVYECPKPFKRLLSDSFLKEIAPKGRLMFLKDTCCDADQIHGRLEAISGTPLKLFNANAATCYDSLCAGAAGYSGVMANYHPDLYKWLIDHIDSDPEKAEVLSWFLTTAAMIEMRAYPVSAKYHMALEGIPMSLHTRSIQESLFTLNAKLEVDHLFAQEQRIRKELGLEVM